VISAKSCDVNRKAKDQDEVDLGLHCVPSSHTGVLKYHPFEDVIRVLDNHHPLGVESIEFIPVQYDLIVRTPAVSSRSLNFFLLKDLKTTYV